MRIFHRCYAVFVGTAVFALLLLAAGHAQAAQGRSSNQPRPNFSAESTERRFRPDFVVRGNGVTLQMPLQLSVGSYIPRWRFGLGYERQIYRKHWAYVQAAWLVDRGDWQRFGSETCGISGVSEVCGKGGVTGVELAAGYVHRLFLREHPYLVPSLRAGLGFARWRYPQRNGSRIQARESAWSLDLRVGAGMRWFLTHQLGVGVDLNAKFGWARHKDRPILPNAQPAETDHDSDAFLTFEILPLCGEFRF